MIAFHGDPKIKERYLARVQAHAAADEIVHGKYWEGGKGCAVGCTIHGSNHEAYETELGIPIALARLEDTLFEGQSNGHAKEFPIRFLAAAKVGADLSRVQWQFLYWLLTKELASRDHILVKDAIMQCANVIAPLTKGLPVDKEAAARASAWAAEAAWAAAAGASLAARASRASLAAGARAAEAASYKRMADKLVELMEAAPNDHPWVVMGVVT